MSWVSIDDVFHSNPKIIDAGLEGAGLYARALSYCGAYLTDGLVGGAAMLQLADRRRKVIDKCVQVGLFVVEGKDYRIRDYLDFNPSRAEVLARREERSKSGKKGAAKRWAGASNSHGSSHGNSLSSSHVDENGNSHGSPYGKTMARAPAPCAAPAPSPTPNGRRAEAAADELQSSKALKTEASYDEPSETETSAAALEAPASLIDVARVCGTLPGADPNTIRQIEPLALQIPADRFRNAVRKVKRRKNVDNPCGLLVTLLRAEIKEHKINAAPVLDNRQQFQASCEECGWISNPSPYEQIVAELAELHVCPNRSEEAVA